MLEWLALNSVIGRMSMCGIFDLKNNDRNLILFIRGGVMGEGHYWNYSGPANGVYNGMLDQEMPIGRITVTDKNYVDLFYLESKDSNSRTVTIQDLYKEKVQWFEPEAKYYQKFISVSDKFMGHGGVKHFSWKDIADFAEVDRKLSSHHQEKPGDWKFVKEGGDQYLLVSVDNVPYWADAIGQIPFAVNCFKIMLRGNSGNVNSAITETIKTGQQHGDGAYFFGKPDIENNYDNLMILRGVLWAAKRYTLGSNKKLIKTEESVDSLKYSVSSDNARKFGY